ncbi:MAG TPA: adenylosuccinate lyase [Saprospiraceae bacterium]|nr:adenylosuccinate lyase [Saprospiraceae bacterium]
MSQLSAVSPIDGRYFEQTKALSPYFSEHALFMYRVFVEIRYFLALQDTPVKSYGLEDNQIDYLDSIAFRFSEEDSNRIKELEKVTNHDIKAVEYFIKEKLDAIGLSSIKEWVHFGLTSQDINNTAFPLMIKDAWMHVLRPTIEAVIETVESTGNELIHVPMLARTHGQPASPTTLGKEILVFTERLRNQLELLNEIPWQGKFGGAVGNMNAHYVAYPDFDWHKWAGLFLSNMGLQRQFTTTQIEHYDMLAAHFQGITRINTILTDLCRDVWTYISMEYFTQKLKAGEVGSSAMPHKVNPIDFENAEGNLGIANALFNFLAGKLPVSRLQRDLTDSTVLRNIGVPYAHTLLALKSIQKGWGKLIVNNQKITDELKHNSIVLAEAIQTILRREHFEGAYEALKALTRGQSSISNEDLAAFVDGLNISADLKDELKQLDVSRYIGKV